MVVDGVLLDDLLLVGLAEQVLHEAAHGGGGRHGRYALVLVDAAARHALEQLLLAVARHRVGGARDEVSLGLRLRQPAGVLRDRELAWLGLGSGPGLGSGLGLGLGLG